MCFRSAGSVEVVQPTFGRLHQRAKYLVNNIEIPKAMRDIRVQAVAMPSSVASVAEHQPVLRRVSVDLSCWRSTHIIPLDFAYLARLALYTTPIILHDRPNQPLGNHIQTTGVSTPSTPRTRHHAFRLSSPIPFA